MGCTCVSCGRERGRDWEHEDNGGAGDGKDKPIEIRSISEDCLFEIESSNLIRISRPLRPPSSPELRKSAQQCPGPG